MATQTAKPMISIFDAATGEQIEREMTDAEFDVFQNDLALQAQATADKEAKKEAKAALLAKLGITADEAALLLS